MSALKKIFIRAERLAKTSLMRVMTIAISVGIGAVYTNNQSNAIAQENHHLRMSVDSSNSQISELKIQVEKMKSNVVLMSLSNDDFPNPKWTKSSDMMMLKLNKAYENLYLRPIGKTREDYIGNYDYDIWSQDIAYEFRKNDMKVMRERRPITFTEHISNANGDTVEVQVTKYPIIIDGTVFGVRGYSRIKYE